jgi:hypothetical protein
MHLNVDVQKCTKLVLNAIGDKAYHKPLCIALSIMISDDARDIVSSKMILT